jgi:zinc protease
MKRLLLLTLLAFCGCLPAAATSIASRVQRTSVHGIDLLVLPTGVRDVVTLRASLPAGDAAALGGNVALATLAGEMLDQGTKRQNKFMIAEQLEAVGATLSFSVDQDVLRISGKCLRPDVPLVLRLLAEQLREPAFDPDEFDRLKMRLSGAFQRQLEDTDARALESFIQAVYPLQHPNRLPTVEQFLRALDTARLEEVEAFHRRHYGPSGMIMVLVGDVDPEQAREVVTDNFRGWTGGTPVVQAPSTASPRATAGTERTVSMDDKPSVSVVWGQRTHLPYRHPDALPLRVGTSIFGSGFTGRLMAQIRDREGLTYGIGAGITNDTFNDGDWRITGTFAPELLESGLASTRRELERWHQEGVTERELAERQTNLAGTFKLQLATTEGLALTLLLTVQRGLELSWIDEYPAKVQALTLEQVNDAIRRHLDPRRMTIVRAGTVAAGG